MYKVFANFSNSYIQFQLPILHSILSLHWPTLYRQHQCFLHIVPPLLLEPSWCPKDQALLPPPRSSTIYVHSTGSISSNLKVAQMISIGQLSRQGVWQIHLCRKSERQLWKPLGQPESMEAYSIPNLHFYRCFLINFDHFGEKFNPGGDLIIIAKCVLYVFE